MRFLGIAILKDLRRLRRDPAGVAAGMAIPLLITVLLSVIFGGGGEARPHGKLLIVDHDRGFVSGFLSAPFTQSSLSSMITVESVDARASDAERRARERVNRDEASALLVIPRGLSAAYVNGTQVRLDLITNPAQRILPGIIQATLAEVLDGAEHFRMAAGDQRLNIANADAMKRLGQSLSGALSAPLIRIETRALAEKRETFNIGALFFPGMLFVSILFVSQALSADIWREDASGTIRRIALSPQSMGAFVGGKTVSAAIVLCGVASAGILCARWFLKLPVANLYGAILWVTFSGISLFLLMLVLNVVSSSETAARVVITILLFLMGMIGGSFFPFEMMPGWLAAIGHWTPNGWAIMNFKAILAGSAQLDRLLAATAGLLAVSTAAFIFAAWRLRRAFLASK